MHCGKRLASEEGATRIVSRTHLANGSSQVRIPDLTRGALEKQFGEPGYTAATLEREGERERERERRKKEGERERERERERE